MPRIDLDKPEPTRFQKLQVSMIGYVRLGKYRKTGWKTPIEFYLFLCKKHGYVTNIARGFKERLECPKCRKEPRKND